MAKQTKCSDEEIEEGDVIKTDPKAGRRLKKEQKLIFIESTGKEKFELRIITGELYDDVFTLLEDEGFKDIKKIEIS